MMTDYKALMLVFNEVEHALENSTTLGDNKTTRTALIRAEGAIRYLATSDDDESTAFCHALAEDHLKHNKNNHTP